MRPAGVTQYRIAFNRVFKRTLFADSELRPDLFQKLAPLAVVNQQQRSAFVVVKLFLQDMDSPEVAEGYVADSAAGSIFAAAAARPQKKISQKTVHITVFGSFFF